MKKLKLMTEEELDSIFGIVERLVPFHQGLYSRTHDLVTLSADKSYHICGKYAVQAQVPLILSHRLVS